MNQPGYLQYFGAVDKILAEIKATQGTRIEEAAQRICDAVAADNIVHIFGAGHSNLLAEEVFFRAGTLAPINHVVDISIAGNVAVTKSAFLERLEGIGPVLYNHLRPRPGDLFIIISNAGRNAAPVELASEAKKHGHFVIALTSVIYSKSQPSRHSSGKLLLDHADLVLDNCGRVGDVCVPIPGMTHEVGPTSTIAGAYILHAMMTQAVFNLIEAGIDPPFFISGNFDGGMEYNERLLNKYWRRIRNW